MGSRERERRKASRHLRRAQELLINQLFGFGVGPDEGDMASETRVPKRSLLRKVDFCFYYFNQV